MTTINRRRGRRFLPALATLAAGVALLMLPASASATPQPVPAHQIVSSDPSLHAIGGADVAPGPAVRPLLIAKIAQVGARQARRLGVPAGASGRRQLRNFAAASPLADTTHCPER